MATIHATATGNWSDTTKWDLSRIPADGDAVIIDAGVVMTMDTGLPEPGGAGTGYRVPATGTLLSLTEATTGNIAINTIGHPPGLSLYATTIQAATPGGAFIANSSNGADHVVNIVTTDIIGGTAAAAKYCLYVTGAAGTTNIYGNLIGGSGAGQHCLAVSAAQTVNIRNSTLKGGIGGAGLNISLAAAVNVTLASDTGTGCNIDNTGGYAAIIGFNMPAWNALATNWTKWETTYHSVAPSKAKVLDDTSIVVSTSGAYEAGTYHEATIAEVQDGVMFGAGSALEGTYAGGGGGGGVNMPRTRIGH